MKVIPLPKKPSAQLFAIEPLLGKRLGRRPARSTIITRQLPVTHWPNALGDPTLADAILDRLVSIILDVRVFGFIVRERG